MEAEDNEFEVTAEMLIHDDVDDERTLDEEEILQGDEDFTDELDDLQKEGEMPLEDLLAMYGYSDPGTLSSYSSSSSPLNASKSNPSDEHWKTWEQGSSSTAACSSGGSGAGSSRPPPPPLIYVEDALSKEQEPVQAQHREDGDIPSSASDSQSAPHSITHTTPSLPPTSSSSSSSPANTAVAEDKPAEDSCYSEQDKGDTTRKGPWYRPGADPEALARLRPVPERRSMRLMNNNTDPQQHEHGDSEFNMWLDDDNSSDTEDDKDYDSAFSDDWKQEIRVDSDHQAVVPDQPMYPSYTEQPELKDKLIWNPRDTPSHTVSSYLIEVNNILQSQASLPLGNVDRDNEQALYVLERCDHNTDTALRELYQHDLLSEGTSPWTEDECRKFEAGLRLVGKDFCALKTQVPTRSVKELVEFYYVWKKTERYDAFAQNGKIGKKKFCLQPGYVSDFMERFLDPPEGDYTELHYGATTLTAEVKRDSSQHLLEDRSRQYHKAVATKTS